MLLCKGETMELFDLHCDTLYKALINNKPIDSEDFEFNFNDFKKSKNWFQCMAMWIPDDINEIPDKYLDKPLINFFVDGAEKLKHECSRLGVDLVEDNLHDKGFIMTLENSSILDNKIENIEILKKYNVKIATLTWNDHNCIGDGAKVDNARGITQFGREVVKEYNRQGIVIDASHMSDALFYDTAKINKGKIIATHSNSRTICSNKRNLTDDQFKYIADMGGLVGLNFHKYFLTDYGKSSIEDIVRHAYYFLEHGGENVIAIGSDFDGSDMPAGIKNSGDLKKLYDCFISHGIGKEITDKIFYQNAKNFFDTLNK